MTRHYSNPFEAADGSIRLVLMRHGQSIWNRDKVFAGWGDIELSGNGRSEAEHAGHLLHQAGFMFDCCFSSTLRRTTETASIVLACLGLSELPVQQCWRLNERHYGALEGMKRWPALKKFGIWPILRTQICFDGVPPVLSLDDSRFPGNQSRYTAIEKSELPRGESLKQAAARLQPCWQGVIRPQAEQGKRVLIVAHKNVLRTLMMQFDGLTEQRAMKLTLDTARPLVYELDHALKTIRRYYIDDM